MADWSDVAAATRAVVDPATSAADLAAIAGAQRGLWVQIASHPNAYPALLEWLSAQGDDTVRAAVASRQQPVALSVPVTPIPTAAPVAPVVAQQPMMGTVAPTMVAAPAPVPRKSLTKPLLIGGAGILVVIIVVVALVIHSASSLLHFSQLQTLADILDAEGVYIESAEDLLDEMDPSDMPSGCQSFYQARNEIMGYMEFDIPNVNFEDDSMVFIVNNHKTALSFGDSLVQCWARGEATKVTSQTVSNVSFSIWRVADEDGEVRIAAYKNVVLLTGDDGTDTRAEWQSYMTSTFKSAVDQAIKS